MAKTNPLEVVIYKGDSKRAHVLCEAMVTGITRSRDRVLKVIPANRYRGAVIGDVAVFYGLKDTLLDVYKDYTAVNKKTVLMDLGYWGRTENGRLKGYHRVVANGLHPNYYYQMNKHSSDRFSRFGITPKPRSESGTHILLAGMSEKAAWVYGLKPLEYEKRMITEIRKYTNKPILYRPKPSWTGARPIEGTKYSGPEEPIESALDRSCVVVTHHSNTAIDAILHGKPCIVTRTGVGVAMSSTIEDIDKPYFPHDEKKRQWLNNIAYTQWDVKEITEGFPWQHLKKEGLIWKGAKK